MSENIPKTLTCPSCGAPLEVDGSSSLVRCKFCKNTAFVPGVAQSIIPDSADALAEIRQLAESGNLIEAIRRYRELYAVGLKDAKGAVEALAAGKVVEVRFTSTPLTAEDTSRILEEVKELLRGGNKIEAIKRYRVVNDVSLTQAKDVIDQIEAALTGIPVAPRPQITGTPVTVTTPRRASRLGCILGLSVLIFVGGILAFIFLQTGGPVLDMLVANGPAILVPSDPGNPDVAASFYNVSDETYQVGLLEAENGRLAWRSESLTGESSFDALAQDDEKIYAANSTRLLAYNKSDGSLAWQTSMPDRLNYSKATLLVTAGRVLTSNVDQSIQAYDAATGSQVWSRRLSGYDRALRMMGDSLVLVDYLGDSYDYGLIFIDPRTGSEQRTLAPGCVQDEYTTLTLDPDSPLIFDPASNSLIFFSDYIHGCIQRLDLVSGQPDWQVLPEQSFSFSPFGVVAFESNRDIFFNTDSRLLAVNKSSGSVRQLLDNEDFEFLPLALSGDTLLVRARRTRGSERFELWGVDAGSGSRLWQLDMGNAGPVDPPNEMIGLVDSDESGFTWKILNDQLVLVYFQANPHQLLIRTLDPSSGAVLSELPVKLKAVTGDFYSIPEVIGWQENRLYLSLEADLYCVDVVTGEILFRFQ